MVYILYGTLKSDIYETIVHGNFRVTQWKGMVLSLSQSQSAAASGLSLRDSSLPHELTHLEATIATQSQPKSGLGVGGCGGGFLPSHVPQYVRIKCLDNSNIYPKPAQI